MQTVCTVGNTVLSCPARYFSDVSQTFCKADYGQVSFDTICARLGNDFHSISRALGNTPVSIHMIESSASASLARITQSQPLSIRERLYQRETLLSSKEVMAMFGVTRDTLCDWVRAGKIPAYKMSDGYKFEPVAIADWLGARSTL